VNAQSKTQWSPLHFASYYGKFKDAQLLLNHGAKVDAVDNEGDTPLYKVSLHKVPYEEYGSEETKGSISVAQLLLESGGDVDAQSKTQLTPLHVASYNGRFRIAQLLLEYGAEVDAIDDTGETPLHDIAQGKYDSEEAGVNIKDRSGKTPLDMVSNEKPKLVQLFCENGGIGGKDEGHS
jgi:ankyrin repeat protein